MSQLSQIEERAKEWREKLVLPKKYRAPKIKSLGTMHTGKTKLPHAKGDSRPTMPEYVATYPESENEKMETITFRFHGSAYVVFQDGKKFAFTCDNVRSKRDFFTKSALFAYIKETAKS